VDAPADAGAVPHLGNPAGAEVGPMSRNAKTALLLLTIALTTFFGIIAKYWMLNR